MINTTCQKSVYKLITREIYRENNESLFDDKENKIHFVEELKLVYGKEVKIIDDFLSYESGYGLSKDTTCEIADEYYVCVNEKGKIHGAFWSSTIEKALNQKEEEKIRIVSEEDFDEEDFENKNNSSHQQDNKTFDEFWIKEREME